MATRTPYQDTSVPVGRSQEQIRKSLRAAGAVGVQFEETWTDPVGLTVRFAWPLEGGVVQTVKLTVHPLEGGDPAQRERQAWRGLSHYLDGQVKAATFGLVRFEDVFLSFFEMDGGRTIGETVIPQLEAGRLALGAGDS